ncbi:MAG: hypothetical protein LBH44_08625, partial [Treponema sp.]|nr:hypothetical protein [Treponema sp.]
MKNITKIFGLAALIAVTVFAFASCDPGTTSKGNHTHQWGEWTVTTPAECETEGEETRVCATDSSHKETRPIAALGHDWGEWLVSKAATGTENGTETKTCKQCGETEDRILTAH